MSFSTLSQGWFLGFLTSLIFVFVLTHDLRGDDRPVVLPKSHVSQVSGISFVLIPAGKFMMGSDVGSPDETPVHEEVISKPFYLAIHEVTQGQWTRVRGQKLPDRSFHRDRTKSSLPVESVSLAKARLFCEELSAKEGRICRLPTEAEWEYACRAGTISKFFSGEGAVELSQVAWFADNSASQSHEVGQKAPDAWGLFDMHGNVSEWCDSFYFDRYDRQRFHSSTVAVRGGSFASKAPECRSAKRRALQGLSQNKDVGFRVVMEAAAR